MLKAKGWIFFTGLIWFIIGFYLLSKGINLVVYSIQASHSPFLSFFSQFSRRQEESILMLVSLALLLGYIKGRFVLMKSVKRVVSRILSLTPPIKVKQVYTKGYFILLLSMMFLGLSVRFLPIASDVRGFIDLTIGAALMNGALLYFRFTLAYKKIEKSDQR